MGNFTKQKTSLYIARRNDLVKLTCGCRIYRRFIYDQVIQRIGSQINIQACLRAGCTIMATTGGAIRPKYLIALIVGVLAFYSNGILNGEKQHCKSQVKVFHWAM